MFPKRLAGLLAAAMSVFYAAGAGAALCTSDLQIDSFSNFNAGLNSVGDATGDDQSMTSISATDGVLSFTPKGPDSYLYESFPCVQAKSQGYSAIQFTLGYPAGATFTLEAQTKESCAAVNYTSEWFPIALSDTQMVVNLDLNVYTTSSLDAIIGFVWATFSVVGSYNMTDLRFVCGQLPPETGVFSEPPAPTPSVSASVTLPAAETSKPSIPIAGTSSAASPSAAPSPPAPAVSPSSPSPPPPSPPASSSSAASSSQPSFVSASSPAPPQPPKATPSPSTTQTSTSISSFSSASLAPATPPTSTPTPSASSASSTSSASVSISAPTPASSSQLSSSLEPTSPIPSPTSPSTTLASSATSSASSASAKATITTTISTTTTTTLTSFYRGVSPDASTFSTALAVMSAPPHESAEAAASLMPRYSVVTGSTAATTPRKSIISSVTSYRPKPTVLSECSDMLIDDWESQSRLTFLYYNSMMQASSDDGTMKSIVVNNDNTVTITAQNSDSYLYSQMPCLDMSSIYGGISMKVKAPLGASFTIQMGSVDTCGSSNFTTQSFTTRQLGWTFDGTLKSFSFPLSKFTDIDLTKVSQIYLTALSWQITLGPMSFYCGNTPSDYPVPVHLVNAQSQFQVATPAGTAGTLLIDRFESEDTNSLNQWHGCDEDCVTSLFANSQVMLQTNDSDLAWYTSFADKCADISAYAGSYLHVAYSGSNKFTIALAQANPSCNSDIAPFPETWDSIEAARYASTTDIYVPMSHFNVELGRVTTLVFKGFYTTTATVLKKVEIVNAAPTGWRMPNKLPSGNLVFACKRPNSFAFAIDDGDPALAQQVVEIVRSENIHVTFFTVGLPLEDASTNLSTVYLDMQARGHQIALHSFTHPKMEGLPDYAAIDWEYNNDIAAVSKTFNGMHTPYFRPPFGTEGARMRQRLATALNVTDPYIVMWSVDVEDWRWGLSDTPEKQLDAFKRDLAKGGNLVVMHYLYPNTVKYLRQFIQLAKATGKQLMRVDQCMMDPRAPPLDGTMAADSPLKGDTPTKGH